eukprot:1672387-Pleurochrysis_carterae.AAC.1
MASRGASPLAWRRLATPSLVRTWLTRFARIPAEVPLYSTRHEFTTIQLTVFKICCNLFYK